MFRHDGIHTGASSTDGLAKPSGALLDAAIRRVGPLKRLGHARCAAK